MYILKKIAKKTIIKIYKFMQQHKYFISFYKIIAPKRIQEYIDKYMIVDLQQNKNIKIDDEKKFKKTIYFDISGYIYAKYITGIQRTVQNFIKYLPEVSEYDFDIKYIVAFESYMQVEYIDGKWLMTHYIYPSKGDIYLSIDLTAEQQLIHKKEILLWKNNGCTLIACVHDLTFLKYPQYINNFSTLCILKSWFKMVIRYYDGIITVSNEVKKEIANEINKYKSSNRNIQLGYFYNGTDLSQNNNFNNAKNELKNNSEIIFIAVSTIEPRKGYCDLIKAFERLDFDKYNAKLIIVGREGWKCEKIIKRIKKSSLYDKRIFWYSNCDDKQLNDIYKISDFYISASYYEGFGIGAIEAASMGIPIIIRDIPVFREIAKNKALYFSNIEDLTNKMTFCCENKNRRKWEIINYLTWIESVEMAYAEIIKIYDTCHNNI